MEKTIAELIENLVLGLISEMLSHIKNSLWTRIKYIRFSRKLSKWIRQFINSHDGSVLTTGDFERYISCHGPVERVFDAIVGDNPLGTKEALLADLINKFRQIQSKEKRLSCQDELILKDLFCGIYQRIDWFYRLQLSDSDRYTIAEIKKSKTEIMDAQRQGNAELKRIIEEYVKEGKQLKAEDARWIYEEIGKLLTDGKAETVYMLLPLLNEHTGDLQYAAPYLINLMSNYVVCAKSFVEIQNDLKDDDICSDIVRKTIYYSLISNSEETLHQVSNRNPDLKTIADHLIANSYDTFFVQTEREQKGVKTIDVEVQKNYPSERWLVLRICVLALSQKNVKNASDIVNELIGKDQSIIERVLYFERKSLEVHSTNYDTTDVAGALFAEIESNRADVERLPEILQVKYYTARLRTAILISAEKGHSATKCIPQRLLSNNEIEMLCAQVSIMNGASDVKHVVQLCVRNNQFWLFNNYLIQFKSDPSHIKGVIENYKFILEKDVSVFLIYVQVISMEEGKERGKVLLESYEAYHSGYLEYWLEKVRLCSKEEASAILKRIHNEKPLHSCSPQTRITFVRMLFDFEYYEEALSEIEREEAYGTLVADLIYIKAMALLKTKREIEAFDVFNTLFAMRRYEDEIVFYLLVLSNRNNREVDDSVLNVAAKSNSSKVLLVLSNYYELHQNLELAEKLLLRSMFSGNEPLEVYGNYLRLSNTISKGTSVECELSDNNTAVYLTSDGTEEKIVYCIHGSAVLPKEPFEWENANHIYKDTAINLGLYRKKTGDTVVINDSLFKVSEILTLDCFLFRLSMQKIVDAGKAKYISMPLGTDGKLNVEALMKELLENINDSNEEPTWLSMYKDMSAVPVTFFFAEQFVRVNYLQLTLAMLRDKNIIIREFSGKTVPGETRFILSFTSIVALHEIGFDLNCCSVDLMIAESSLKEVDIESEQIISDNSREHVASIGVYDGQLYFNESSEEAKQTDMQSAVSIKTFAHQIKALINSKDLQMEEDPQFDCKSFFGICDYDTLAIASEQQHTLVTFEATVSAFAGYSGINVKTIGIADFLAVACNDSHQLIEYVQKMMELRFMFPFSVATIARISTLYRLLSEQDQKIVFQKWIQALKVPLLDENYKRVIAEHARKIYVQAHKSVDMGCPIWMLFAKYTLQYMGYKLQWYLDPKGELTMDLVAPDEG